MASVVDHDIERVIGQNLANGCVDRDLVGDVHLQRPKRQAFVGGNAAVLFRHGAVAPLALPQGGVDPVTAAGQFKCRHATEAA